MRMTQEKGPKVVVPNAVVHARLPDGLVLPVVDVANPSFRVDDREANLIAWRSAIAEPGRGASVASPGSSVPPPVEALSELAQRIFDPAAGYLDGWATYLMKVGAQNLPRQFDTPIEQRLLSSPNAMSLRVRLQQIATIMAAALQRRLSVSRLRLLTIGGGTAIEALNALILLRTSAAQNFLPPADIAIMDIDQEGSQLGKAALEALRASQRLPADWMTSLEFHHYSWNEPLALAPMLRGWAEDGAFVLASSEGALFEYASDEVVRSNLQMLHEGGKVSVAGSVIRNDAVGRAMAARSPFELFPRGIQGIRTLANAAGYRVSRVIEGVATDQFLLEAS